MTGSPLSAAFGELGRHPWRTAIAIQGILWAVALTIVPTAILEGTRRHALERAEALGTNRIEVSPDPAARLQEFLQESDLAGLRAALDPGVELGPLRVRPATGPPGAARVWLLGADSGIAQARSLEVVTGRLPRWPPPPGEATEERVAGGSAPVQVPPVEVALVEVALERRLARALYGQRSPLDQRLYLHVAGDAGYRLTHDDPGGSGRPLVVTGVVSDEYARAVDRFGIEKGKLFSRELQQFLALVGFSPTRPPWLADGHGLYLPRELLDGDRVLWLFVRCEPARVSHVTAQLDGYLAARGRRLLISSNALWRVVMEPELDAFMALHDVLTGIFLCIGFLVMTNLLVLSGWRRRPEIALRRVEGASRGDIFRQFISEGLLQTLLAFLLGVPAGMFIAQIRVWLDPGIAMSLTWPWLKVGQLFLLLAAGALVISSLPAWLASRHPPMKLLRRAP